MSDGDYVLGTRDDEVQRLGLQHQVWRNEMLAGMAAAGIGDGQTLLDIGAGPGHATADHSALVGETGRIVAYERSPHFLETLRGRRLGNVDIIDADLVRASFGNAIADGAWIRWVLAFLPDPAPVVAKIAAALKPGGKAVFHEYLDYEAWRLIPESPTHRQYLDLVVKSWRDSGGEPDAARQLPNWLRDAGMEIVSMRPMVRIITRDDPMWNWLYSFTAIYAWRLHELGYCSEAEAQAFSVILDNPPAGSRMLTPVVAEVIAVKR